MIKTSFETDGCTIKTKLLNGIDVGMYNSDVGYSGFASHEFLDRHLVEYGFTNILELTKVQYESWDFAINSVLGDLSDILKKGFEELSPTSDIYIYIIPIDNDFIRDTLNGISGFSPYKNTIHCFIDQSAMNNLENKNLTGKTKELINSTILHEYHHSQYCVYNSWDTILDGLVAEGLAECFVEKVVACQSMFYKKDGREYFKSIKNPKILNSTDSKMYQEVFTAGEAFPLWTGYFAGYYVIDKFLSKNPSVVIAELTKNTESLKSFIKSA